MNPLRLISASLLLFAIATLATGDDSPHEVRLTGTPGTYTLADWKKDWPGCTFSGGIREGRVALVERESENWLRVNYAVGEIGPDKGGAGWRFPVGTHDAVELQYTVRFGPDFDWVKGGKLPGICGGPQSVSGGKRADGTNGFSVRLMWRREGAGEVYVYHKNQPGRYGESFRFPDDVRYPTDKPIRFRLLVTMNDVGKRNGTVRAWTKIGVDRDSVERLLVERTDLEFRTVDTFGADSVYFDTFHGGNDTTWAPTRPTWAEYGQFRMSYPK